MIENQQAVKPGKLKAVIRFMTNLAFIVLVFWLGMAVGNGQLTIHGLKSQNPGLPKDLDYKTVEQIYDSLKQNYDGQLDVNKLLDGLKHGLAQATGDTYTDYFSPSEAKDFKDQLNGTFQGIGAELSKDKDGNLIVVAPIAGFPADKAGLKPKDVIISINGTSTTNLSVDEAVSRIRGPKGTVVELKVIRDKAKTIDFKITRDDIKVPSVASKTLAGNIGYIKISEFSDDTGQLANQAAKKFKSDDVKAVILDLRGDPGGELSAAVDVASLWLKPGSTVLTTRRGNQVIDSYISKGDNPLLGIKTIVLIDGGSASASEIVSGALHDDHAATLFGVKSFGKGSVQDIINFSDGSLLKVTIARWYTPDGKNIDKQGITPDKIVARTDKDIQAAKDPQLAAALASLK